MHYTDKKKEEKINVWDFQGSISRGHKVQMKKFIGDNDPTLSPKSVFFTIRKCCFKKQYKRAHTQKWGDTWKHRRLGRIDINFVLVLHSCWCFFPEDLTPWRKAALNLVAEFFYISKRSRWCFKAWEMVTSQLFARGTWKMTFWALVATVPRKLRAPLTSWNWVVTPSRKGALLPFMASTIPWVSALLAC